MHEASFAIMQNLFSKYLDLDKDTTILDIGSLAVSKQPSYKEIVTSPKWHYTGTDIVAGNNVDVIMTSPVDLPFLVHSFNVVISGQTLEHVEFPYALVQDAYRVLLPGGLIFLVAPGGGKEHHKPDYWRILPDGMRAILKNTGFDVLEVFMQQGRWHDVVGVGRKRFK
jgi:SAM-dependent methyltransferase